MYHFTCQVFDSVLSAEQKARFVLSLQDGPQSGLASPNQSPRCRLRGWGRWMPMGLGLEKRCPYTSRAPPVVSWFRLRRTVNNSEAGGMWPPTLRYRRRGPHIVGNLTYLGCLRVNHGCHAPLDDDDVPIKNNDFPRRCHVTRG